MKTLPPQHLKDGYWQDVEAQLKTAFYDIVFKPVLNIMRKASPQTKELKELTNAGGNLTALLVAIRSGRVQYVDGRFAGEFSVAIARDLRSLGATWNGRSEVWTLAVGEVPEFVRIEAANYQTVAKGAHDEMLFQLNEIQEGLDRIVQDVTIDADVAIRAIEKGWKKSAARLEVQPLLTKEGRENLEANYTNNLKLYIRNFSQQSVDTLREAIEANAMEGYRFDKLTEVIRHRYGVTANKANFLARQETSLFMSKYRKERFAQAGVRRYRWSTAHDERVRDSHRHLNGRIFSYDDPPITDRHTGAKNNPGEDFNCRCVDEPILEYDPFGPDAGKIMSGVG